MKKLFKSLIIVALMLVMVLALTGCGNKVVATKDSEDGKEKIEIKFKDDKVDSVKWVIECEDETTAAFMGALMKATVSDVEIKGKKVTMKISADEWEDFSGDEDATKEEIIESLEDDGYEVK